MHSESDQIFSLKKRLLIARAQLQSVGEALSLGVWTCTPDGGFDYASKPFLDFLGIPLKDLSAFYIFERAMNTSTSRLMEEWSDCIATGREWDQELKLNGANGEVRTVRSRARCMRDEHTNIICWTGVNLDMTDRKVAEIQLKDSNALFAQLTETLSDQGVWMISVDDKNIKYLSPGVANIWGITEDEIRHNPHLLIENVHEDDRMAVEQACEDLSDGHLKNLQYRIVRPDGNVRWVKVKSFPVKNSEGRVYNIANIATDITEFKNIQAKLKNATRSAMMASRVKTQFLANMSHEIRTPLGAILGFTELIARSSHSPEIRNWIEIIQRNGTHLLGLIDEILDISQIEANRFEVEFKPTDPYFEAREAIQLLANRARQKKLDLEIKTEGKIPPQISCDPTRLRQILINLVGNAIKFTDQGFVHLTLRATDIEHTRSIEFLVKDSGKGIPEDHRARLFQPFMQGDSSTKRTFGGTGLGLAISRAYAQALGGSVELVESRENEGTTFTLRLPTEMRAPRGDTREPNDLGPAEAECELANVSVLVVDDAPDNRELISLFLKKSGALVECAASGVEGIRKATTQNFDVILMDIQMPGIDGVDTTKRLRAANYDRPILALTAHAMKSERDRYLRSGFNDHLSKPINQKALIDAIARFSQPFIH